MAATDAMDRQPRSLENTVYLKRFYRVTGTGGVEAAIAAEPW
jgi:hypothetical protein